MAESHPEHEMKDSKSTPPVWAVLSWTCVVMGFGVLATGLLWGEPTYFPGFAFGLFILAVVFRMRNDRLERERHAEA